MDALHEPIVIVADRRDRLDKVVASALPEHSRSKLARLMQEGLVLVDGEAQKPSFVVEPGMVITLDVPGERAAHDLTPADIPLTILYEDEAFLIVDKPRGLATHPAASLKEPSLVNALLARGGTLSAAGGEFRPGIVHRLDKETTGLLMVAKTDAAHVALAAQMEAKTAERRYLAVVAGWPDRERFSVDAPIGRDKRDRQKMAVDSRGKTAVTHVLRLRRLDAGSLLAVRLETGRTHQIRVHLRAIGHPVLGDRTYAPRDFQSGPLQLHAAYLRLSHPVTGATMSFFSPPPEDFLGRDATQEELESV